MSREETVAQVLDLQAQMMRSSMRHHSQTMVGANLTPVQFHLLLFLHSHRGIPTAEAADAMGVRANIATGVVQRLVDRGWVAREPSPEDGRVRLLSLTSEGDELVNQAVSEAEQGFIEHLNVLSDEQVEQLRGILQTFIDAGAAEG
ncbi:MarR family winged helix-turn-helix transcriptional regulator [Demequina sediminicola]|uniref:MarR family winged helix-turn-helix transcriptional regulator n=1 Tax=Demequina sediminicola TaxID=1095026 RepID=UPI00128CA201|nr:MarR family transcriptional regulator [Demequina sediminicola]